MQQKIFDNIVKSIFGKSAGELASLLFEKKNVNEFLIAKKLVLTPNQARNILYKFSHLGFASFIKKKDKRKGWYTYFWSINIIKILDYIRKELEKELGGFESQLKSREDKRFYVCPICKIEVNEETALLHDFVCLECGNVYELSTGEKASNDIKAKIKTLSQQLGVVKDELSKFEAEKSKKDTRARKREEAIKKKEKEKKRAKSARARKKARKALAKIAPKKSKKAKKAKKAKSKKKGNKR